MPEKSMIEFRNLINALPDIILILKNGEIILANEKAELVQKQLVGTNIKEYLLDSFDNAIKRLSLLSKENKCIGPRDYDVRLRDGSTRHFEMTSNYLLIGGEEAILTVARDITSMKKELNSAARVQKKVMLKKIPILDGVEIGPVYVPAKTVSGDFYFWDKLSDEKIIGVLGDIPGKGISAAMNISAFEILFHEAIQSHRTLQEIVRDLNEKVSTYFQNKYVAAILFIMDLKNNQIELVSAGINEFYSLNCRNRLEHHSLRGPFLGMFNYLEFDGIILTLNSVKRIILFTDGVSELIQRGTFAKELFEESYNFRLSMQLTAILENQLLDNLGLKDDSTALIIDFGTESTTKEYILEGLSNYQYEIERIVSEFASPNMFFQIQLILMELITNAFKYGNDSNEELPIKVIVIEYEDRLIIEVIDFGVKNKQFIFKTHIEDDELMDESGRGLYLINQFADYCYYNGNSVIAEIEIEKEKENEV